MEGKREEKAESVRDGCVIERVRTMRDDVGHTPYRTYSRRSRTSTTGKERERMSKQRKSRDGKSGACRRRNATKMFENVQKKRDVHCDGAVTREERQVREREKSIDVRNAIPRSTFE